MYCKYCGNEINDKAYVCLNCGAKVAEEESAGKEGTTLGIIGLCFIFLPIVTFICSGIGLSKAYKVNNTSGKVLNYIALGLAILVFIYKELNIQAIIQDF